MFWNGFWSKLDKFAIFSFWNMVDFVLNILSELANLIQKRYPVIPNNQMARGI